MAKITNFSPEYGMPHDTPVFKGIYSKCDELGPEKGCGTIFVTDGTEKPNGTWPAKDNNSPGGGPAMGWIIPCPRCGRGVHVRNTQIPLISTKKNECFVATCCFGDLNAPEVVKLRQWRDESLSSSWLGQKFTACYYNGLGEYFAAIISRRPTLCKLGRKALGLFIRLAV